MQCSMNGWAGSGVLVAGPDSTGPVGTLALWVLPLTLANLLVAAPIWALTRRILGAQRQVGLFTPR